jgi:hypothetical protein
VQLTGNFRGPLAERAERAFAVEPAPHPAPGQSAEVVRGALRDRLLRLVREFPLLADEDGTDAPGPPAPSAVSAGAWKWVKRELTAQEVRLFWEAQEKQVGEQLLGRGGGCTYCHIPKEPRPVPGDNILPQFEKPNLPSRWFVHSRFNHHSHRAMQCTECHASAPESSHTGDVLLPDKDACARCHRPVAAGGTARADCIECHRYHPRQSSGSGPRSASRPQAKETLGVRPALPKG